MLERGRLDRHLDALRHRVGQDLAGPVQHRQAEAVIRRSDTRRGACRARDGTGPRPARQGLPDMDYPFRRQDFYTGLILCVVSLGIVVECWRMPRDLQGWPAYASPGVVTGLLGLGLFGMGLALTLRSVRRAGAALPITRTDVRAYLADAGTRRLGLMLGLSVVYCLLLGRISPIGSRPAGTCWRSCRLPGRTVVADPPDLGRLNAAVAVRLQPDLLPSRCPEASMALGPYYILVEIWNLLTPMTLLYVTCQHVRRHRHRDAARPHGHHGRGPADRPHLRLPTRSTPSSSCSASTWAPSTGAAVRRSC